MIWQVNAIDTAIARGGDQVVISKYGEENEYLGAQLPLVKNVIRLQLECTQTLYFHTLEKRLTF